MLRSFAWLALGLAGACAAGQRATRDQGTATASAPAAAAATAGSRRIDISVTENGFEPNKILVAKDENVALVFTRKTDVTCAKEVIVYVDKNDTSKKITKALPLNQPVEIAVRFAVPGEHGFACAMGHRAAVIEVK